MRLFIAVNFNEDIKMKIKNIQDEFKKISIKGNFTLYENLHLTLIFLGEVPSSKINDIKEVMMQIELDSFKLKFNNTGMFKRNGGDIYWAGIEKNNSLEKVHKYLCEKLTIKGFNIEKRAFKPHLTLAREVVLNKDFNNYKKPLDIKSEVNKISLMKSERINGKLKYTSVFDITDKK